ncbi:MAG: hypothetical protein ACO3JL_06945 [Myxococcota bacterium]
MTKLLSTTTGALQRVPERAVPLLIVFCAGLIALNAGRLDEWGEEGFRLYLTQAIMQTTLYDFGWVLLVTTWFVHQDAKTHGLRYWWVLPTYPFMPTLGLLAYFIVRQHRLHKVEALRRGSAP